ncbi:putative DNA-binding protein [Fuchsiella alkaliacetigena]|nr:putative DNA-binding protein [Fuchsiella alkaliacetigena]MCK8825860.1 putative DNA-binding protein [Fuchsiella alkaliacetigena]
MIPLLERTVKIGLLFDFYGELLTDKQQQMIKLYFYQDLSLGEIAEEYGISRQAVYDNLKRAEAALEEYESKLDLLERYQCRKEKLEKLRELIEKISHQISEQDLEALEKLTSELLD